MLTDAAELPTRFAQLAADNAWKRVATHCSELNEMALGATTLQTLIVDDGYAVDELESCDAGLTACEALIAQTGSVLVSSQASGGRALSVLPPHHVVVARAAQMVGDLSAAFALLRDKYGNNYPSLLSFITVRAAPATSNEFWCSAPTDQAADHLLRAVTYPAMQR